MHRGCAALTLLVAISSACERQAEPGPAPYGFDAAPEQHLRVEGEDETRVDDAPVRVRRYADVRLTLESHSPGRHQLSLYLVRYFQRVEGAPGGPSEIVLSEQGLSVSEAGREILRLSPTDARPGGGTLGELLEQAIAGCELEASGMVRGDPWHSLDPLLGGVEVLDWLLFAFPVLSSARADRWEGRRRIPPLGQYRLGMELPFHYEWFEGSSGDGGGVRASGLLQRTRLEVAPGLVGQLQIDARGETRFGPAGRVRRASLELDMRFEAESGPLVSSRHRTRILCLDCEGAINSARRGPDSRDG